MVLAPLAIIVPVVAATLLAAVSPLVPRRLSGLGVAGAVACATLTALVLARAGDRLVVWFGGWEPRDGVAVGVGLAVDRIGGGLALFVALLAVVSGVMTAHLIRSESSLFDALSLTFLAAMVGFCLTGDLFNQFVFFELMSVAAIVLVGYEVRQRAPLEGSLAFAVTNTVGAILLLFGIGLLYGRTGALNMAQMGRALAAGPHDMLVVVAFALVAGAFLLKAAIVPFHFWTADAYAVAPTPICILLAGAYSELGLYGVARVWWTIFEPALAPHEDALRWILVGAGVLTGLVGAVMCAGQHHLKRMLAFATIAQVGLFLVGIGMLSGDGVAGAAVWVVADGLVKASLFACVSLVQHRYGLVEEGSLHGRARKLWPIGVVFCVDALMIASLPTTGSFLGKSLVEDAALEEPGFGWVPAVLVLVTGVLGGTLLRAAARVFWGIGARAPGDPEHGESEEEGTQRETETEDEASSPLVWGPAVALLAAAVVWGVLPGLLGGVAKAAADFVDAGAYRADVLGPGAGRPAPVDLHPPGHTAFLYSAGTVVLALAVAAATLARGRGVLPAGAARALDGLRDLHNGRPGDYVAWAVTGLTVLGGLFAVLLQ